LHGAINKIKGADYVGAQSDLVGLIQNKDFQTMCAGWFSHRFYDLVQETIRELQAHPSPAAPRIETQKGCMWESWTVNDDLSVVGAATPTS